MGGPYDEESKIVTLKGMDVRQKSPTLKEQLIEQRAGMKAEIERINKVLDFLDKNPSFEQFDQLLTAIGRGSGRMY